MLIGFVWLGRSKNGGIENILVSPHVFFFFLREFQLMASAPDDGSLSLDQDTNRFLV